MKLTHVFSTALAFVLGGVVTLGIRTAIAAPTAPPKSAPPPVAPPSVQPSAPQTLQAAQAAERQKYYTVSKTFLVSSGAVTLDEVACKSAFDFPVTGGCSAPQNSGARLTISYSGNSGSSSLPFYWRCGFFNDSAPVQAEASVVCKRP
ncbi:MAG: hypothetical protein KIT84_07415 [Labilithrix sp.]|nr:hypothetical protein [Labilithrix sp.]MCW5810823.1 hypothetical protein [Labilithrix sp.]